MEFKWGHTLMMYNGLIEFNKQVEFLTVFTSDTNFEMY